MKQYPINEGYMPFLGYQTYYRIVGEPSSKPALLLLHGGPGSTHNYFEVLDRIADTGRQVISYDQIGCGNSYLDGHPELWTQETWINELIALREYLNLEQVHLLGQSWGAMQAIAYIIDFQPKGVKSIILSSGHASSSLWASEQHRLITYMSAEDQDAIRRAEATGKWDAPDYLLANEHYYERYVISVDENSPECLRRPKRAGNEAYLYGWGPNEYQPLGNLSGFEYTDRLHQIKQPCLICSGTRDICTPVVAASLYENIPDSRWEVFKGARHTCFVEQTEKYCDILKKWLEEIEQDNRT
jgi:proline iminopeptidase